MKWLFATLVGLNLIVFAGMIASKIYKPKPAPATVAMAPQPTQTPAPPPVVINMGGGSFTPNNPNNGSGNTNNINKPIIVTKPITPKTNNITQKTSPTQPETNTDNSGSAQVKYRNCSARVSMPEDDYHRIKGLLARFPHAATRQVVQGGGEGDSQTSSRMNVLFMSVSDEDANTIQGIVGRYGSLSRSPGNK